MIKTVEELYNLALNKKAVKVTYWKKPVSASFLINWQGKMLVDWIRAGRLSVYKPNKKI